MKALRWLLLALVVLPSLGPLDAHADPLQPRFGAVNAYEDGGRADELGVGWSRLMFRWDRVQRVSRDEWWPAVTDDVIDHELSRGRELVGLLVNTPPWASTDESRANHTPPMNLHLPVDHPENYWAEYVRRTASAYRGRIDTWIIWNEPDIWDPHHPGYTWSGSVEEFYRLQKVAYQAARRGNPEAKVLLPGLTYFWDQRGNRPQFFARLLDVAAKDPEAQANDWFFDAAVLQLYNDPHLLYNVPREYKQIMAAHGIDKPIWINETNVAPWDDFDRPLTRAHYRANQEEQASYVIQAYSLAMAAGVDRISIYKLRDDPEWQYGWESYGVVRAEGSVRPSFTALQMVHRLFADARGGSFEVVDGASVVSLRSGSDRIVVVWSGVPRALSARLAAASGSATLYRRDGSSLAIAPVDGWYRLDLAPATHNTVAGEPERYQVGGEPLIIVEQGAADAPTRLIVDGSAEPAPTSARTSWGPLSRAIESLREASTAFR